MTTIILAILLALAVMLLVNQFRRLRAMQATIAKLNIARAALSAAPVPGLAPLPAGTRVPNAMITPDQLPEAETLIGHPDGSILALMFHFLPEGVSFRKVAEEQGFDIQSLFMENDLAEDDPLYIDYFENAASDVLARWNPTVPDRWMLGGKFDTEDGPCAVFIRPTLAAAPPAEDKRI